MAQLPDPAGQLRRIPRNDDVSASVTSHKIVDVSQNPAAEGHGVQGLGEA